MGGLLRRLVDDGALLDGVGVRTGPGPLHCGRPHWQTVVDAADGARHVGQETEQRLASRAGLLPEAIGWKWAASGGRAPGGLAGGLPGGLPGPPHRGGGCTVHGRAGCVVTHCLLAVMNHWLRGMVNYSLWGVVRGGGVVGGRGVLGTVVHGVFDWGGLLNRGGVVSSVMGGCGRGCVLGRGRMSAVVLRMVTAVAMFGMVTRTVVSVMLLAGCEVCCHSRQEGESDHCAPHVCSAVRARLYWRRAGRSAKYIQQQYRPVVKVGLGKMVEQRRVVAVLCVVVAPAGIQHTHPQPPISSHVLYLIIVFEFAVFL